MHYHRSSIRRVAGLNTSHEHKKRRGVIRDTVVRPGSKLVLSNFPLLRIAIL